MEALVGKRDSAGSGTGGDGGVRERVLSTLLNEMDGVESCAEVLVVAATNRPDKLDAAFLRPGRIDAIIYVPPPVGLGFRRRLTGTCGGRGPLGLTFCLFVYSGAAQDFAGRKHILRVKTAAMPLGSSVALDALAAATEGFSGADLESLCREAALRSLRETLEATEVTMEHFEAALRDSRASLSPEQLAEYARLEKLFCS